MQIQRIQSLYIVLSILVMAIFIFTPYGTVTSIDGAGTPAESFALCTLTEWGLCIPSALTVIILVIGLFTYRQPKQQRGIVRLGLILTLCCIGVACFALFKEPEAENLTVSPTVWCLAPVVALIFEALAIKGITHDIRLLASADRLR